MLIFTDTQLQHKTSPHFSQFQALGYDLTTYSKCHRGLARGYPACMLPSSLSCWLHISVHNLHKHFKLALISATPSITLTCFLYLVPHKAAGMPQLTKGEGGGGEPADCFLAATAVCGAADIGFVLRNQAVFRGVKAFQNNCLVKCAEDKALSGCHGLLWSSIVPREIHYLHALGPHSTRVHA